MITIKKTLFLPDTYPLERIGNKQDMLFFDIETTGFSGDYSNLYLIGCAYYQGHTWHLIQWFADTKLAEVELLHAFFAFLKNYKLLIHFNGDGFDIPYLLKRCAHFNLSYNFSNITSIDIYKKVKVHRKLLALESLKQKSIESFLGISREDQYSGGQLISVYEEYLFSKETYLYNLLLLHNEDDLKGMPTLLPILQYCDFFEHSFTLIEEYTKQELDLFGDSFPLATFVYESDYPLPVPLLLEKSPFRIECENNRLTLTVSCYQGTLKYFFPDYKNYFYLIDEDIAVHKSIGEFMERSTRKKATAKTCYTKKSGCFLPMCSSTSTPIFQEDCKSKQIFVEYTTPQFQSSQDASKYLKEILGLW